MSVSNPGASPIVTTFRFHLSAVSRVSDALVQAPDTPTETAFCPTQADDA